MSNAFEEKQRIPFFREGVPILGMEKFLNEDKELVRLFNSKTADLILSPNSAAEGSVNHSTARTHGDFDDDKATVNATLGRILNKGNQQNDMTFKSSASSLKDRRDVLTDIKTF